MSSMNGIIELLNCAVAIAKSQNYEYISPEVLLLAMCQQEDFVDAFTACGGNTELLAEDLKKYLDEHMKLEHTVEPDFSFGTNQVLMMAQYSAESSAREMVELSHVIHGMWSLKDSYAVYYMKLQDVDEVGLLQELSNYADEEAFIYMEDEDEEEEDDAGKPVGTFLTCLNDVAEETNPLIGRESELERTIQILCRKDKNNPLHIGEPGVGKTAITYGLARMINEDKVPKPIRGAKIYSLDLGSLLAGTQYRGDLEKRLKKLLDEISKEEKPIIYIDEIHNLSGAGATGEGSFDASNMLKPYLAQGSIRFIGATTFEEYKKYFEKNKSLVRRFQNVEVLEPSLEETVQILKGLKKKYEKFHGVHYGKGVLEYAAQMSKKYINDRFLPDKAIDLIDEAGAYRKIHPLEQKTQTVGKDLINEILSKICRVPVEATEQEKNENLATLKTRIQAKVFGQEEAVEQVVNAVKFSKAGLIAEQKPLSSFLFVGPTGVGKTEVAKTLAHELGVKLVRFDMSEYGEKHAVAKLIGAPAGYVGYEEGGLLTDAIRKTPSCVLLLDEIEKAHPDIYNILLQVMDDATLTDNQGRKADFRNVIIIMTSNAGASRIGKPGLGFQAQDVTSDIIMEEVKHTFQPEFRNRLNKIVVFKGMNLEMAGLIAEKKLKELALLLAQRKVIISYIKAAAELLQNMGYSKEFAAREMDRVIQNEIKPLLVDDLLFGKLKDGGNCELDVKNNKFVVTFKRKQKETGKKE